ncbi:MULTISPECIES: helix-turn-helix domain-containing protein [Bacillus cereus group]|uniref:Helix-turn-helix domain-containing protein n=1 Tax=Bacillus cereus TaxID=1396 RepID=A0A9W7UWB3_BACCE|nr:helix-turn-helix domain-containing protein [Bacillus cereus]KAB2393476.1 helix-turn-helix domain-containing protein [Bacillus cereus]KAB2407423.1 helix-turn-helix domain-containing protein [Bacillus cereus]KAB2428579.1 helix-turn-helix domain-containing protein [Bacillus cereus]
MNKSFHLTNTKYVCQLLFQTFEVPVHFLDKDKNVIYKYICNDMSNPFYSSKCEQFNDLYWDDDLFNFPIIRTTDYLENFILIHIVSEKIMHGTFIIGPVLYSTDLESMINRILNDRFVILKKQETINYYQSLPIFKRSTLLHVSVLLYYMIYGEKIEVSTVEKENITFKDVTSKVENPDVFISVRHQNHHECVDLSLAIRMFEAIKSGEKEKLLTYLYPFTHEETGILCLESELRNRKNQGIAAIALATKYAIDGGLPSDTAFAISDLYIQNLEKINDIKGVEKIIKEALCIFADYVEKYKNQKLSKTVLDCKNYILKNIYQELSLKQLANHTGKNPVYLSTLFKKEVGMSLNKYIQLLKIEEAKKLLTLTQHSLLDISTLLNFNNQSYFTKVFKECTGITPKQYRNQYAKS